MCTDTTAARLGFCHRCCSYACDKSVVLQQSGLSGIRDNSVSQGQTNVKQTDRWGHVYTVNTDQGLVNLQENVSLLNSLTNGQCAFS